MKQISQFDWPTGDTSFHSKQISVHTRELAPETDSCYRFAPWNCFLISNQFDMREQNSGGKVLLRNICFRYKSLVQTSELCTGSVLREKAPSCVPALKTYATMPIGIMGSKCLAFAWLRIKVIQQQGTRKNEYTCLCCFFPPSWNTLRFNQTTIKTTITHNNFRHCRVRFSLLVRKPFSKQLYTHTINFFLCFANLNEWMNACMHKWMNECPKGR